MNSGKKANKPRNAWTMPQQQQSKPASTNNLKNPEQKFKEVNAKLKAAVEKHAKDYVSSEEEDELETKDIIDGVFKFYTSPKEELSHLGRTKGYLEDAFLSGANTCLFCMSSVKRTNQIWNCHECYCSFHLECIQRWAKDTITQRKQKSEDQIQVRQLKIAWYCPNCRHEYQPQDIPSEYRCFCGKVKNPTFQSLLIPHSCGEKCGKLLKPLCGHTCVLLCHPGPCPPCPQTVTSKCYCGSQPAKMQRCCNKEWSCGSPCKKTLVCGKHKCPKPCHQGDCPPCSKKSIQKCLCGSSQKLRDCETPLWQCDKVCSKPLRCGHHSCPEVCHPGACGDCVLSKGRTCPCGKSHFQLPCTEETPTCEDTCAKLLECGQHRCYNKCHKDKCGSCAEIVTKSCRCGAHTKEVQCKKPYLCNTKCKQMKDCLKHPCNRKCCDGNCPPCEKPCGQKLNCGNHKCASVCHRGPCYPCQLQNVFCRCGATSITVPCGRKHKTCPPKCSEICKIPPDCHHPERERHKCHFGDCPSCRQICNKLHEKCSHICLATCHTSVLVKVVEEKKGSMPWEQTGPVLERKCLPCPDCEVPVSVTCLGLHETSDWPCFLAKPSSCGRPCGRILPCGNHTCAKVCHVVLNPPNETDAGEDCDSCHNPCTKDRPNGCPHPCPKPCHPGNCPPCKQMVRIRCHCGLNQPYVACKDWIVEEKKEELQSCGDQCPLNYPCGHRCRANCHSGPCPNSELCKKKVKVTCKCRRLKKEFSCETVRNGGAVVSCDEVCVEKKKEVEKMMAVEEEQKKIEEELKNQKELEKFEKKFHGKKKQKERKVLEEVDDGGFFTRHWVPIVAVTISVLASIFYTTFM